MKVVRSLMLSLLITSSLGSSLMTTLVYLDFELRRDYISSVLCIERKKPLTVCYGRCYLNKRLAMVSVPKEKCSLSDVRPLAINFFSYELRKADTLKNLGRDAKLNLQREIVSHPISFIGSVFKPPRLS